MNKFTTKILYDGRDLKLYNAVLNLNDSLELSQRFSHDATSTSQSLVSRKRNTALAGSLRLSADAEDVAQEEGISIFEYIMHVQELVGGLFTLVWYGKRYENLLCKSVQVTPKTDAVSTFSDVEMNIQFVEGVTIKKSAQTTYVSTL